MKNVHICSLCAILTVLTLVSGLPGCGVFTNKIELTLPDGDTVPWGGSIQIVAAITEQGKQATEGGSVTFTTTVGSFEPYGGTVLTPVQELETTVAIGQGKADLYNFPGESGKTGTVTVSYVTIGAENLSESISVSTAEGGRPSGKFLTAQCDAANVQALGDPVQSAEMKIRCTLTVKDITGESVPIANISTMVEEVCTLQHTAVLGPAGEHVFSLSPDCIPADVEPMPGEPSHMDAGVIHNPRDGLLTIMFYVEGQEGFLDSNQNGVYDPGEGFVGEDQPEPYLDINDDGVWNSGEPFKDVDENGLWSPANGRWDGDTWIWTSTRILFSGPPHESIDTTHYEPTGINLADGSNQTMVLYLMDENHNPIASHNEYDDIYFTTNDAISILGDYEVSLLNNFMGVEFGPSGIIVESFNQGRDYQISIEDSYPGDATPRAAILGSEITWTPAPPYDTYYPDDKVLTLTDVSGTAN